MPAKYVDRLEVLDELLCWGWVDGLARKLDDERTMQLISPRRQQKWSKSYKERCEQLEAAGRMQAPGLAAIATSKALHLWDACEEVDLLQVPHDLREALDARPQAPLFFEASAPSYTRLVQATIPDFANPDRLLWPPRHNSNLARHLRLAQPSLKRVRTAYLTNLFTEI